MAGTYTLPGAGGWQVTSCTIYYQNTDPNRGGDNGKAGAQWQGLARTWGVAQMGPVTSGQTYHCTVQMWVRQQNVPNSDKMVSADGGNVAVP